MPTSRWYVESRCPLIGESDEERGRAEALLANIRDVVVVVNGTGSVTYASAAAESLLGTPSEQLVGCDAFDLVHPDDQLDAFEGFQSTLSSADSRPTPLLLRLRHADGTWVQTELIATNHFHDPAVRGLLLTVRDVSNSLRTEQSLRESEARYRLIVELAHEGIWMVDRGGTITFANRALAGMLRTTVADLVGRSILEFMDSDAAIRAEQFARRGVPTNDAQDFRLLAADGTARWVRISANPLRLHDGTQTGVVAVVTDVTERRELEERLAHDARHDALTGVANRHTLFDVLTSELSNGKHCAVLFADLDHFKEVNDTYGHRAGDEILRVAAARITAAVRGTDTVARVGGDEFVIVCTPVLQRSQAVDVAARIVASFNEPICIGEATITAHISVGMAQAESDDNADSVLARADHALYSAKRAGRNRLELASTSRPERLD